MPDDFEKDDVVVTLDGLVGKVVAHFRNGRYRVQLGANGPFALFIKNQLRLATPAEVWHLWKET